MLFRSEQFCQEGEETGGKTGVAPGDSRLPSPMQHSIPCKKMFQQYCSKVSISGRTVSLSAVSQLEASSGGGSCLTNVSSWALPRFVFVTCR